MKWRATDAIGITRSCLKRFSIILVPLVVGNAAAYSAAKYQETGSGPIPLAELTLGAGLSPRLSNGVDPASSVPCETLASEAREQLQEYLPRKLTALLQAHENNEPENDRVGETHFDLSEANVKESGRLYQQMFRVLGRLPMRWDAGYFPEQVMAREILVHAPCDQLKRAVKKAASSRNAMIRQGAARLVFSEETCGGCEGVDHMQYFRTLLGAEGYENPFPENRLIVAGRLQDIVNIESFNVLALAVEDPDERVRREAMLALNEHRTPISRAVLRTIQRGRSSPRHAEVLPEVDYGDCITSSDRDKTQVSDFLSTDSEFASYLLERRL